VISLAEDSGGGSAPFRAQALRVGKWDYPGLDGGLVVTPELLTEFKTSFDLHAKGPEVPLNLEHDDAKPCGWVRGLELSDDGQTLYALFDVTEPDVREKVKNGTYRYVSSELDLSWNDPEGHFRGRPVFDGLALTTRPYIKRMEPVQTIDLTEGVTFEASAEKEEDVERTATLSEMEVRLSEMQAKLAAKDRELAKYRSRSRLTEVKARLSELATKRRGAVPLRVSTHVTRLAEILLSQGKERIKLEEPMIIEEGTDTPVAELDVIDEMLELIESVVEAVGGGGDGAPESVQLDGHPSEAPTGDLEDDLLREAQVIMSEKRAGSLKEALLVAVGGRNGR
jgi:hypothetical protein